MSKSLEPNLGDRTSDYPEMGFFDGTVEEPFSEGHNELLCVVDFPLAARTKKFVARISSCRNDRASKPCEGAIIALHEQRLCRSRKACEKDVLDETLENGLLCEGCNGHILEEFELLFTMAVDNAALKETDLGGEGPLTVIGEIVEGEPQVIMHSGDRQRAVLPGGYSHRQHGEKEGSDR